MKRIDTQRRFEPRGHHAECLLLLLGQRGEAPDNIPGRSRYLNRLELCGSRPFLWMSKEKQVFEKFVGEGCFFGNGATSLTAAQPPFSRR